MGGNLAAIFREMNRIMRVNGCFMFTTLGPDTFKELTTAWKGVDEFRHVNDFIDMHDIGDTLMRECFLEPVMDMEILTIHYKVLPQLLTALKLQGVRNIHAERNRGLTGKASWQRFAANFATLQTSSGKYPLTYEVIYGHAWKGEKRKMDKGIETLIPLHQVVRG